MSLDKLELKRICSAWAIIALKPFLMLLVTLLLFIIVTESSWNIDFIQKPMFIRLFIEFPYPKITLHFLFLYFFLYFICENVQQNQFNWKLHCEYKTWLNFKKFTSQSANTDKIKLQLNRCFHKFNSVKYVNVRRKEHKETTITTRTKRNGTKEEREKVPE